MVPDHGVLLEAIRRADRDVFHWDPTDRGSETSLIGLKAYTAVVIDHYRRILEERDGKAPER
jgi:hypothetical protein